MSYDIVKLLLQIASWLALLGTILPPVLFSMGRLELHASNWGMLVATLVWFIVAGGLGLMPRSDKADVS